MFKYVAIGILAAVGCVSAVAATRETASAASQPCAPSPGAGAIELFVAPGSVPAGQATHFRIENIRGPAIIYGPGYSVQECVAGAWTLAPFSPTAEARVRIVQRPSRGRWQRVQIPATAVAEKYRVRKSVSADGRGRWLYGEFEIVAPTGARRAGVPQNPLSS